LESSLHARLGNLLVLVKTTLCDKELEDLFEGIRSNHVSSTLDDLGNCNSVESLISYNDSIIGNAGAHFSISILKALSLNNLHFLVVELN